MTLPGSAMPDGHGGGLFPSTHWSVLAAAATNDSRVGQPALEKLCRAYWSPLFQYLKSRGHSTVEAEDLTQGFFERLLRGGQLGTVDRDKGRFRSWLLAALRNFLVDEWRRGQAQRRGGGSAIVSLDQGPHQDGPAAPVTEGREPELAFDREWALTVLQRTHERLRNCYAADGQTELYEVLQGFVSSDPPSFTYAEVGERLGMNADTVRSAIFRLRRRFQRLIREVVAETIASPTEVDEELRHLVAVLRCS